MAEIRSHRRSKPNRDREKTWLAVILSGVAVAGLVGWILAGSEAAALGDSPPPQPAITIYKSVQVPTIVPSPSPTTTTVEGPTVYEPGQTVTITVPGPTVTVTVPGPTQTVTQTVTETVTVTVTPSPTVDPTSDTVTNTPTP